jgi:hypothetical protein
MNQCWAVLTCCLLFTILCPFETKVSIRWKVDHGRQIVLWYWQHVTNLARATVFVICMSLARVLVWVRGRAKQRRSLTLYVFGQTTNKCSSSILGLWELNLFLQKYNFPICQNRSIREWRFFLGKHINWFSKELSFTNTRTSGYFYLFVKTNYNNVFIFYLKSRSTWVWTKN